MAETDWVKIIASIDIGTSYSKYAYIFVTDGDVKSAENAFTWKTKTSLLLTKEGKFLAYGDEAEEQYITNNKDGKNESFLFRGFKKDLYNNPTITKNTSIRDISGKHAVPAVKIFTLSLWYLKNHLMRTVNTSRVTYNEDQVMFTLPVPAVWNNKAKAVMRLAATNADIKLEKMSIVLESECASVFHQSIDTEGIRQKGKKYVIVDFGGGTVDIAAHVANGNGAVESLHSPAGGNCGGSNIEECFRSYLCLVFGLQAMEEFMANHSSEYLHLLNDLDSRRTHLSNNTKLSVSIPITLQNLACQKLNFANSEDLRKHVASYKVFQMKGSELVMEQQSLKGLYEYSLNCLSEELNSLFKEDKLKGHACIIMSGGLTKSKYVQEMTPKMVGAKNVSFPNTDFDVAKGAILLGKSPDLVMSRVVKLTYGIKKTVPFDDVKHKGGETAMVGGVKVCTNVFHVLMKGETVVNSSSVVKEVDKPLTSELKEQLFVIYTSGKCDGIPKFTSDPTVNKEADFTIPLPFGCLVDDKIFDFHSIFGEPEVKFSVTFKKHPELYKRYLTLK